MEGARSPKSARRGGDSGLRALLRVGAAAAVAVGAAVCLVGPAARAQNESPVFEQSDADRERIFSRDPAFEEGSAPEDELPAPASRAPRTRPLAVPERLDALDDGALPEGPLPEDPASRGPAAGRESLDLRFPGADEPLVGIRIEGNVTIPESSIAHHIRTRPDRPATEKQIREDVRALYATRWFFSVEPRFVREEKGLVLVFHVLERPIVKRVEYRGRKKIAEKHLAAETGLKPGSPFDVSANGEAARRVEAYYHEKGFAFATVELAKGGHMEDREVVFDIKEGPKVRVTSVKFTGNRDFSDQLLATKLQTKKAILWLIGGKYDPATIPDDIAAIKQYYHSLGYFDVKVDEKVSFSDNRARARIEYFVEEGIRYKVRSVEIAGNRIFSEGQIREKLKLTEGQYFNSRHLDKDVDALKTKYGDTGRLFARVDAQPMFLDTPGYADLVYRIDEDKPYRVGVITVSMNKGEDSHTKESVVLNMLPFKPGDLASQRQLKLAESRVGGSQVFERGPQDGVKISISRREDREKGDDLYRGQSESFEGARYTPTSGRVSNGSPETGAIPGAFPSRVEPVIPSPYDVPPPSRPLRAAAPRDGSQSSVTRPSGASSGAPKLAEPSGPFTPVRLKANRATMSAAPRPVGAEAGGKTLAWSTTSEKEPPLEWRESDPRKAFFNPESSFVVVRGQNAFDGPLDQPTNPLFGNSPQGDPFNNRTIPPQPDVVDLNIDVTEARTGRLMFGVGVNSDAGVVGNIVLTEQNFDILRPPTSFQDIIDGTAWRGAGQKFRLEAVPGNVVSRYLVSWTDPYFLNTDYSFGLSGFYFNRFFPDWTEERAGGRITIGRQFTPEWSVTGALRLEHVTISDPDLPAPPLLQEALGSNFLSTARVGVTHDTRDAPFLPGSGHIATLSYEQAFGDFLYPRFEAEGSQYFTIYSRPDGGGRHILSLNAQANWTDTDTPIFERYFAGGFQTFRGFAFRGVGPKDGNVRVGGRFMAVGSVEYMFPIMANEMVQLVAFTDFGTVEENVGFEDFRLTVGGGLRVTVPAMGPVPLAFDWGIPILKEDDDETRIFSFYVGVTR